MSEGPDRVPSILILVHMGITINDRLYRHVLLSDNLAPLNRRTLFSALNSKEMLFRDWNLIL